MRHIIIFLLLFVNWIFNLKGEDGRCHKRKRVGNMYKQAYYCCENYENLNGMCVECTSGYITKDGEPCRPCPKGRYGHNCVFECNTCKLFQRCDHIIGCTNESTSTEMLTDVSELLVSTTGRQTITDGNGNEKNKGLLQKNVVLYTISIISVLVIVTLGLITFRLMKKKFFKEQQITARVDSASDDGSYDEIDDTLIAPERPVIGNTENEQESSSNPSSDRSVLNPYTPIVENTDVHDYTSIQNQRIYFEFLAELDPNQTKKNTSGYTGLSKSCGNICNIGREPQNENIEQNIKLHQHTCEILVQTHENKGKTILGEHDKRKTI